MITIATDMWFPQAFKIETAGSVDSDVEMKVYAGTDISIDFDKSVDIFNIQTFLSQYVFGMSTIEEMAAYQPPVASGATGGYVFWALTKSFLGKESLHLLKRSHMV